MGNAGKNIVLGFDIGTSGLKCLAYDTQNGRVRCSLYSEWKLSSPKTGYAEFGCDMIWEHIIECILRLRADFGVSGEHIASIGFCALCPGLIALDKNGNEISPCIIFMDARSGTETAHINSVVSSEESFPIIGNRIMSGATSITTILWIKNKLPELYERTKYFTHLPGWAGYKLTGRLRMDLSNASGTGLYDVHAHSWSETMASAVGIDIKKLPPLAESVELLGGVKNDELIALGISPGTPVSCGAGDTVSALLAMGIDPHRAMLSLGTSHVLYTVSDKDSFSPMLMARSFVCKNTWAVGGAMSNPGAMLRWFRDKFCPDLIERSKGSGRNVYELIDEEAAASAPGAGGVLCLPYINGERSPVYDSDARGVFTGINLNTCRADISRAIMEGAAYGIRQLLETLEKTMAGRIDTISVTGGGSRSDFLVQLMADVTQRRMEINSMPDIGALGAAITGAVSAKILSRDKIPDFSGSRRTLLPNPALKGLYDQGYQKYIQLYPALKHLF